jgi:hypothetical protein
MKRSVGSVQVLCIWLLLEQMDLDFNLQTFLHLILTRFYSKGKQIASYIINWITSIGLLNDILNVIGRSLRLGCDVFVCSAGRSTTHLERLAEVSVSEHYVLDGYAWVHDMYTYLLTQVCVYLCVCVSLEYRRCRPGRHGDRQQNQVSCTLWGRDGGELTCTYPPVVSLHGSQRIYPPVVCMSSTSFVTFFLLWLCLFLCL